MPAGAGNDSRACYSLGLIFNITLKSKTRCPMPRKGSLQWRDYSISWALFLCPLIFRPDSSFRCQSTPSAMEPWKPWDVSQPFALGFSSSLTALLLLQCVLQHGVSARSPLTVKKNESRPIVVFLLLILLFFQVTDSFKFLSLFPW